MSESHKFTNIHSLTFMIDTVESAFGTDTLLLFTIELEDDFELFFDDFWIFLERSLIIFLLFTIL
jgi:hypothetical protein